MDTRDDSIIDAREGDILKAFKDVLEASYNEVVDRVKAEDKISSNSSQKERGYYNLHLEEALKQKCMAMMSEALSLVRDYSLSDNAAKALGNEIRDVFGTTSQVKLPSDNLANITGTRNFGVVLNARNRKRQVAKLIRDNQDALDDPGYELSDKEREQLQQKIADLKMELAKLQETSDKAKDVNVLGDDKLGTVYEEEKLKDSITPGVGQVKAFIDSDGNEVIKPIDTIRYADYENGERKIKHGFGRAFSHMKDDDYDALRALANEDGFVVTDDGNVIDTNNVNTFKGMGGGLQRSRDYERLGKMTELTPETELDKGYAANIDELADDYINEYGDAPEGVSKRRLNELIKGVKGIDAAQLGLLQSKIKNEITRRKNAQAAEANANKIWAKYNAGENEWLSTQNPVLVATAIMKGAKEAYDQLLSDIQAGKVTPEEAQAKLKEYSDTYNKFDALAANPTKRWYSNVEENWQKVNTIPNWQYPDDFDSFNGLEYQFLPNGEVIQKRVTRGAGGGDDLQHTMLTASHGHFNDKGQFVTDKTPAGQLKQVSFYPTDSWLATNGGATSYADGTPINRRNGIISWIKDKVIDPADISNADVTKIASLPLGITKPNIKDFSDPDFRLKRTNRWAEAWNNAKIENPEYFPPFELKHELSPELILALSGDYRDAVDAKLANGETMTPKETKALYDDLLASYDDTVKPGYIEESVRPRSLSENNTDEDEVLSAVLGTKPDTRKSDKLRDKLKKVLGPTKYEQAKAARDEDSRRYFNESDLPKTYMQQAIADGADPEEVQKLYDSGQFTDFDNFKAALDKINPKVQLNKGVKTLFKGLVELDRQETNGYIDQAEYDAKAIDLYKSIFGEDVSDEEAFSKLKEHVTNPEYKDVLTDAQEAERKEWEEITHQNGNTWSKDFTPDETGRKAEAEKQSRRRLQRINKKTNKVMTQRAEDEKNGTLTTVKDGKKFVVKAGKSQTESEVAKTNADATASATSAIAKGADKVANIKPTASNKAKQSEARLAANDAQREQMYANIGDQSEAEDKAYAERDNSVGSVPDRPKVEISFADAMSAFQRDNPDQANDPQQMLKFINSFMATDKADGKKDDNINLGSIAEAVDGSIGTK